MYSKEEQKKAAAWQAAMDNIPAAGKAARKNQK